MIKIVALGNALVDVLIKTGNDDLLKVYDLPRGSMQLIELETANKIAEDTKQIKPKISSGGSAANTINGLAKLGIETGFIGKVGNDEFGQYFEKGLKTNNITPTLSKSQTPTGRAYTFISSDGERTFATYLGAAIEQVAEELKPDFFNPFQYLHVEGYLVQNHLLLEKAFQLAKDGGLKISIDLASYNVVEDNLVFLLEMIEKYVNIVFANEEEAKAFTGCDIGESIHKISGICDIAIVKTGKEGSMIKTKNEEVIKVNSIEANCIDTTGAGDLYASGFLYGLANGFDLEKCGKIGSITAGRVIENIGACIDENQWELIKAEIKKV